jgi:hypothetical protein
MFRIFKKKRKQRKENKKTEENSKTKKNKKTTQKRKNPAAAVLTGRPSIAPPRAERGSAPLTDGA